MQEIPTLQSENDIIKDVVGRSKLIVSDVDYTLTDFETGHMAGIQSLKSLLGDEIAQNVDHSFHLVLDGHRFKGSDDWDGRDEFNALMGDMKELQPDSREQYGVKVWSREAWIILAARKLGRQLSVVEIEQARDTYWRELTINLQIYPDAANLLDTIHQKNIPLILFTGSDSIMQVTNTPTGLQLSYDPDFSKQKKKDRLKHLPLKYDEVVIGDPIDKPNPEYFDEVENVINKFKLTDRSEITFIGDSPLNDLQVPEERGYRTIYIHRS